MNTIMNDNDIKTLPQVRAFLDGTGTVEFTLQTKSERYDFVRRTLIRLAYHALSKPDKGVVLSFLVHVSGYSRIQVKRLVKIWLKHGQLRPSTRTSNGFTRKYTDADRRLRDVGKNYGQQKSRCPQFYHTLVLVDHRAHRFKLQILQF